MCQRIKEYQTEGVCLTVEDEVEGGTKERQVDDLFGAALKGKVRNRTYLKAKGNHQRENRGTAAF